MGLNEFGLNSAIFGLGADGKPRGIDLAGHGVTIFFTLSGFLITYLLLKEKELQPLNVKNFYLRRLLRIWPLYYLYMALCLITCYLYGIPYNQSALPFYLFLAANIPFITENTIPFLAHFWSLGVEEQFYLFFPQIAKLSNRRLLKIAIGLIAILLLLKCFFWVLYTKYSFPIPFMALTVTRIHIMLIGVVAALFYYQNNTFFIRFATRKGIQIVCWLSIFIIAINRFHIASVIDSELIAGITVLIIIGQITKVNRVVNLENDIFDFLGKISYGLYVLHPLVLFYMSKLIGRFSTPSLLNYILVYTLTLSVSIGMAYLSYEYYEKWFLRLKERYAIIKSRNSHQIPTEIELPLEAEIDHLSSIKK